MGENKFKGRGKSKSICKSFELLQAEKIIVSSHTGKTFEFNKIKIRSFI